AQIRFIYVFIATNVPRINGNGGHLYIVKYNWINRFIIWFIVSLSRRTNTVQCMVSKRVFRYDTKRVRRICQNGWSKSLTSILVHYYATCEAYFSSGCIIYLYGSIYVFFITGYCFTNSRKIYISSRL